MNYLIDSNLKLKNSIKTLRNYRQLLQGSIILNKIVASGRLSSNIGKHSSSHVIDTLLSLRMTKAMMPFLDSSSGSASKRKRDNTNTLDLSNQPKTLLLSSNGGSASNDKYSNIQRLSTLPKLVSLNSNRKRSSILNSNFRVTNLSCKSIHICSKLSASFNKQNDTKIYKSPFPSIELPEVDLGTYMLSEMGRYATSVALVDAITKRQITYSHLAEEIRRLACSLTKLGIQRNDVVLISCPNCLEYPSVVLATCLLGAVYSPVNPAYTTEELSRSINMTKAKLIVASELNYKLCEEALINCPTVKVKLLLNGSAIGWTKYADLVSTNEKADTRVKFNPKEDVASIPFSSGTTGYFKAVMLTHYNIVSNIIQNRQENVQGYNKNDVLLAVLPFFHIYANIMVLMTGLASGTKIVILPSFHLHSYYQAVTEFKCNFLHIVPPILLLINKHPIFQNLDLGHVRTTIIGAAPVAPLELQKFTEKLTLPGAIRQGYGLTETSPLTHISPPNSKKWESIGQAIQNTQFKFKSLPSDESEEAENMLVLYIKGPQVMKGYLDDADSTNNVLSADGWLETGDVGYADEDEFVYIIDRKKELIKVKGFQVAPAELEALLLRHPAIVDAGVVGCPDEEGGERPVAFVVLRMGCHANEEDVKRFVAEHTAKYKHLARVKFVDKLPKSQSGKILRRLLSKEL